VFRSQLTPAMNKINTLYIRTPEGIVFSQPLAGPMSRFLAWGIDVACIGLISTVIGIPLSILKLISLDFAEALALILYFLLSISYGVMLEWYWRGQTVGKRIMRLRVIDAHGLKLHAHQIIIRNLLRSVDILPLFYLVGGLSCLLSRRAQRLGDIAASTVVVRIPRREEPDLDQLLAGKFNSLRSHPHLEARLRQRISPAEARIGLQALLRRDQLDATARIDLFQHIAAHYRAAVQFPPDATEGVTDEQYVRNVVDVLYRPKSRVTQQKQLEPVAS
jgi:uncharacterized RDD family membrane protein YckC